MIIPDEHGPHDPGPQWQEEDGRATGTVRYLCCFTAFDGTVEAFMTLTPMPGYGPGTLVNMIEANAGNRVKYLFPMPAPDLDTKMEAH